MWNNFRERGGYKTTTTTGWRDEGGLLLHLEHISHLVGKGKRFVSHYQRDDIDPSRPTDGDSIPNLGTRPISRFRSRKKKSKFLFTPPSFPFFSELRLSTSSSIPEIGGCCCPICGMPLRPSELEAHYSQELEYLSKLSDAMISAGPRGPLAPGHPNLPPHHPAFGKPGMHPMLGGHHPLGPHMANGRPNTLEVAPRSRWDVSPKSRARPLSKFA